MHNFVRENEGMLHNLQNVEYTALSTEHKLKSFLSLSNKFESVYKFRLSVLEADCSSSNSGK